MVNSGSPFHSICFRSDENDYIEKYNPTHLINRHIKEWTLKSMTLMPIAMDRPGSMKIAFQKG